MMDVMNVRMVSDTHRIPWAIDAWELKVKTLVKDFPGTLSDSILIALMTSMVPTDLQDIDHQAGALKSYEDAKMILK